MASTSEDKKKKKKPKPWEIPPSSYNKAVFTLSNPFVALRDLEAASVGVIKGDRIGDGKQMDPQVLGIAVDKITKSSFSAAMSYKQPTTEVGGRIVHGALILDLYKVTKRRSVRSEISPEQMVGESSSYDEGAHEELTGLCVASIENEDEDEHVAWAEESESGDSNASIEVRHKGDDPEDATGDDKTNYDFKIIVQDQKITGFDKAVTVLVVECSWENASTNKVLQAAAYVTRKDGFQNIAKGRYEPIFLESWGKDNWKYGVFYLFGIVTIKDGAVSTVSSKLPKAAFADMLNKSTENLRKYLNDLEAVYPNGDYIHGILYVPRGDFKLPDVKSEGSGDLPDTDLFFQSLIRIVCGDTALNWTVDHVMERIKARKDELKASQARWRKRARTS